MKRRLFNLAAAVSLVLILASAALWVRSYWVAYLLGVGRRDSLDLVWLDRGVIIAMRSFVPPYREELGTHLSYWNVQSSWTPPGPEPGTVCDWHVLGFQWVISHGGTRGGLITPPRWTVGVPLWFTTLVFAFVPSRWALHRMRIRRAERVGRCRTCGYDLRATPERCPECGTAVAPKPAEAAA
jgi:hypothetical protein